MIKKYPSLALCLFFMISLGLTVAPDSHAVTDDFERASLGPNWAADPEYGITNGKLINSATVAAWDYLATFNGITNPNEVSLTWAGSPYCDENGAKASGVAICLDSFSPTANGYFIYERNGFIYLYPLNSGSITGSDIDRQQKNTGAPSSGPGKTLMVRFFPADFTFKVYINNVHLGDLQDPAKTHNYGTYYSGVFLLGNVQNGVESFSADVVATGDTTPPSPISDLAAAATSSSSIQLTWTATGDDGTGGTASAYDVRYSTDTITAANFDAATQATGVPSPKASGQAESFSVTGLNANTPYYFAVKAADEAFNWSSISNVPTATTDEGGVTPPPGGEMLSYTDNFDRGTLGGDWAATGFHQLVDGTLGLTAGASGTWDYLATFIKAPIGENPAGVAMKFDEVLSDPPASNGTNTCGFGLMLDSPSSTATGYLLLYRNSKITLYSVVGGSAGDPLTAVNAGSGDPNPGDVVQVMISTEGGDHTFTVSKNGNEVATIGITNPTHNPGSWYTGVMQVGGFNNNVTYYTVFYEGAGEAGQITEHYGNFQQGPIFSTLSDSIAVRVSDATGNPFQGTVVDFQVVQGTADLSIEEFEYDGLIWYECEKGAVVSPAIVEQDDAASGSAYVTTPFVEGNYGRGRSIMNVYVPEMGNFDFYLRIICPSGSSNSFYYKFNEEDSLEKRESTWANWRWRFIANKTLDKGFHKIHVITREPGVQFDKILLNDKNKNPTYTGPGNNDKGGTGPLLPNMSDENGIAYTYVTFGSDADNDVLINATAYRADGSTQLDGSPVVFTLDPLPGAAVSMEKDPGLADPMVGPPGAQMQTPLRVIVKDEYGNRVPGVSINWAITQGSGGSLSDNVSLTDENGEAITHLTLSLMGDNYTVQATNGALTGSPVTFNVVPGNPPQTVELVGPKTPQTAFAGTKVDSLLTVRILDDEGNPFKDYPVEFNVTLGGGSVAAIAPGKSNGEYRTTTEADASVIVKSDANGIARAEWTLGNSVGLNTVEARASGLIGSPISFTATGELGPPALLTKTNGDAQTGPVGLELAEPLEVLLTDAYGNPIPSKAIKFIVDQGTGAYIDQPGILEKTVYTNTSGLASVVLTMGNTESEEHLVRATAVGTEIPAVVFTSTATAPIAAAIEYVSGNGIFAFDHWVYQDTVVTYPLKDPFVVKVVGPFGKPVANHPVTFSVVAGGGNLVGNAEVTVPSNAEGLASAKLTLGTLAGDSVHIVEAVSFREDLPTQPLEGAPVIFKGTARPKPASKLVIDEQTNNQTGQVGQPLPKPVQVLVTDVHGNYIPRHFVTFEIQGNGGQLQDDMGFDQVKQVQTGADDGHASIVWHMPETPGMVSLLATSLSATGENLTGSPAEFIATAKVGNPDSMARVTPDSVLQGIAGKKLAQRPTVKILDALGNPNSGYPVTFKVEEGQGTVNGAPQVTVTTNAVGEASVEWTLGTKRGIENNVITASASVSKNKSITFVASAGPDVAFALQSGNDHFQGEVGAFVGPVSVSITDQYGNGVPQFPVTFDVIDVEGNVGYIDTPGTTTKTDSTDDQGKVQVNWALGPKPGARTNKLQASAKRQGVHLKGSPKDFFGSALSGVPDSLIKLTDDTDLAVVVGNAVPGDLRVKVTDHFGNPLARQKVTFTVLSTEQADGGTLDNNVDTEKVKETNSAGIASVKFYAGRRAGKNINKIQVEADYNGEPLIGSPVLFEITGLFSNADSIEIADGNAQKGTVGKFLDDPIEVVVFDEDSNPVRDHPVNFKIITESKTGRNVGALGPNSAIDTTINSDYRGVAKIRWRMGHVVGTYQVEAGSEGGAAPLANSPLTFSAVASADSTNADSSSVGVFPPQLTVSDGSTMADVNVTLRDKYGNPVAGRYILLSATGEGNILQNPAQGTTADGQAIGKISSRIAGVKYVTARDVMNNITLKDSGKVTFLPGEAKNIAKTMDSGEGQTGNIGTVLEKPLKVRVTDNFGNSINGFGVIFTVTQGNGMLMGASAVTTDSNGVAGIYFQLGTKEGTNTVEARADGLLGSPVVFNLFGIQHSQLASLEKISGDQKSACPGDELPEMLCVSLKDVNNWPVWGESVLFRSLMNDGLIMSENPIKTDRYGTACVRANVGTTVGTNVFQAVVEEYQSVSTTFYDTTKACDAAQIEIYSGDQQKGTVEFTLSQPLCVRTSDEYDNPVGGENVTFSVVDDISVRSVGSLENNQRVVNKTTNNQGVACVYYTLGPGAGLNKVRARGAGLQPTYVEFSVYGSAGAPYSMEMRSGNNQRGEMGKELLYPICVTVRDAKGNPTEGGYVEFYVTHGGGNMVGSMPVPSDVNGKACARWQLGPRPIGADNRAEAISSNLAGPPLSPIQFKATGDVSSWPELHLPDRIEAFEGQQILFEVHATEEDGDFINYRALKMPDSTATFAMNNLTGKYEFNWTPGYETVKSPAQVESVYPVFRAEDRGGFDVDSVEVVVRNVNRPPVITSYAPEYTEDNYVIYQADQATVPFSVNVMDPDGDVVYIKWTVNGRIVSTDKKFDFIVANYPVNMEHLVKVEVCDQESCTEREWIAATTITGVELAGFSCTAVPYKGVTLEWNTSMENQNAGFHVLRSRRKDGQFFRVNEKIIPPNESGVYTFCDPMYKAGQKYLYKLQDVTTWGKTTDHGPIEAVIDLPKNFDLSQNYPNPFNPVTRVRFQLPKLTPVKLEVFNIRGELVKTLVDRHVEAGYHIAVWDATNNYGARVSSGIYYYRITAGRFIHVKKMAFLK